MRKKCLLCGKYIKEIKGNRKYHQKCSIIRKGERQRKNSKKWRTIHKEEKKEYLREKRREDYYKHIEKRKEKHREWCKNNKEHINEYHRKKRKENIKQRVGRQTLRKFKRDKECSICKSKKNLEFHHWKYRIPIKRKDFSTLCKKCHGSIHRREIK